MKGNLQIPCLIHTLANDDEIKQYFSKQHTMSSGWLEIKNRKYGIGKQQSIYLHFMEWQKCCANNGSFKDVHSDFTVWETIAFWNAREFALATLRNVSFMKGKILQLKRIFTIWERYTWGDGERGFIIWHKGKEK